jgi:hypothetical protein
VQNGSRLRARLNGPQRNVNARGKPGDPFAAKRSQCNVMQRSSAARRNRACNNSRRKGQSTNEIMHYNITPMQRTTAMQATNAERTHSIATQPNEPKCRTSKPISEREPAAQVHSNSAQHNHASHNANIIRQQKNETYQHECNAMHRNTTKQGPMLNRQATNRARDCSTRATEINVM